MCRAREGKLAVYYSFMGLTLSHTSALYVTRKLRSERADLRSSFDHVTIAKASASSGARWTMREFRSDQWRWPRPDAANPLHVLASSSAGRVRMSDVVTHLSSAELPAQSVLWLDEHANMVSPELLFVQMATMLSMPELVMLGYELCGVFTRWASDPVGGPVTLDVPPATTVEELREYMGSVTRVRGAKRAREALEYVSDNAASVPEAVLATMYSLPSGWCGYGMGPVELNRGVVVATEQEDGYTRKRYPDIMFSFAPVGINYDGGDHLDLDSIAEAAHAVARADALGFSQDLDDLKRAEKEAMRAVRAKVVDDMRRNRELIAQGSIVLPMTKEDLYEPGGLDRFTRQLLRCARLYFGAKTANYEQTLDDSDLSRERSTLLRTLLP
ncbi:MAG: hypothetical protein Q4A07_09760 [Coriobacteriales bacterium]|nr:hypothetical protein [Coriobacteriales bacterium]